MSNAVRALSTGLLVLAGCWVACQPAVPTPLGSASANDGTEPVPAGSGASGHGVEPGVPVAAPGEVVLHARWARPSDTISGLASYTHLPDAFVWDVVHNGVKEFVKDGLRGVVDVAAFAEVVSLDAPVDLVVVAELDNPKPKFRAALSIGLTSFERARGATKGELTEVAPGVWRMGSEDGSGARCALAETGAAPGKLVCGQSYKEVTKLAPYMARGLPTAAGQPTDLHLEVHLKNLIGRFGGTLENMARGLPVLFEDMKIRNPVFDNALNDAATALSNEAATLIYDIEGLEADAGVDAQKGVTTSVKLLFANKRSWLAQTLLDGADKQGPAPDVLWKLPRTSEGAFFGLTGDQARWAPIYNVGQALLGGFLQREKLGDDADRGAIVALLAPVFATHVPYASASGHFAGAPAGADTLNQIADAVVGWELFGIDQPSTAIAAYLDQAAKVYNRPNIQTLLKKEMKDEALVVKSGQAPAALGRGGVAYELTLPKVPGVRDPAGGKPKTTSLTAHLLILPDGNRTWLGVAMQRDPLAKLMGDAKNGSDSLAGSSALAALQNRHATGAFMTLGALTGPWSSVADVFVQMFGNRDAEMLKSAMQGLPNKGATPITLLFDQSDAAPMSVSLTANVPRGTLEDVGAMVAKIVQSRQR